MFIKFNSWKISAKWLSKRVNCTFQGITQNCKGNCCKTKGFWPPNAFGGECGLLTESGCAWGVEDKPITCLLYPLKLNKNNTLVLHSRVTYAKGICKGNYGNGNKTILEVLEVQLTHLFGAKEYEKMKTSILVHKKDYILTIPEHISKALEFEGKDEEKKLPPIKRTQRK